MGLSVRPQLFDALLPAVTTAARLASPALDC